MKIPVADGHIPAYRAVPAKPAQQAAPAETVDVVAPQGIEFAEPPLRAKKKGGGGAGVVMGLAAAVLVLIGGVALGFTRYGFFGSRLFSASSRGGSQE